MSKKHAPAPTPPANRPHAGPGRPDADAADAADTGASAFQEQDPKRRIGGFEGAGEHARQQPSDLNDGTTHSQ